MSTNFGFLQSEWPQIYESAVKAEAFAIPDPGTACFHARRTLELVMHWLFKSDSRLRVPYQNNLSALVHEPTFLQVAGHGIQTKARIVIEHGNRAVHADCRVVTRENAVTAVRELFQLTFWMARTYARGAKPADSQQFAVALLPATSPVPPATKTKLQELEASLAQKDAKLAELCLQVVRQTEGQAAMDAELQQLRAEIAEARKRNAATRLQREVAAMTVENFLVRPHRRLVERFAKPEAWETLSEEDRGALRSEIAGLPSAMPVENPEARQFDLLLLRMQLTLLRGEPGFNRMRENVQTIARLLEAQVAIPVVAAKLPLIQELQSSPFWEDVNIRALEQVRKGLRDLVQFIERRRRATVITDFEDELREGTLISLPGTSTGVDLDKVRDKALVFLRKHEGDPVLHKLRFNEPLTSEDLDRLEEIFMLEGSTREEIEVARKEAQSLGLFVRSVVGMDREAAKSALSRFTASSRMTANQMEFINLIVNHLATRGVMELARLYESPFTDVHPFGLDGLFQEDSTVALLSALTAIRQNAIGLIQ